MKTFAVGFLVVFGAVGGMENPEASLLQLLIIALVGLAVMAVGVANIQQQNG